MPKHHSNISTGWRSRGSVSAEENLCDQWDVPHQLPLSWRRHWQGCHQARQGLGQLSMEPEVLHLCGWLHPWYQQRHSRQDKQSRGRIWRPCWQYDLVMVTVAGDWDHVPGPGWSRSGRVSANDDQVGYTTRCCPFISSDLPQERQGGQILSVFGEKLQQDCQHYCKLLQGCCHSVCRQHRLYSRRKTYFGENILIKLLKCRI